jgi:hypothetical protein
LEEKGSREEFQVKKKGVESKAGGTRERRAMGRRGGGGRQRGKVQRIQIMIEVDGVVSETLEKSPEAS